MSRLNPVSPQGSKIQMCCISLNWGDLIRLICVPEAMTSRIRSAIGKSWGEIQNEKNYHGGYEFKLKGNPWAGEGEEAVKSHLVITSLFACMAEDGWNVIHSGDVNKKGSDKATLFFERMQPDPEAILFAVSFTEGDKLRLIGAPAYLYNVMKQAIAMHTKIDRETNYCGSFEIKLNGVPWYNEGEQALGTKMLLCQILAHFKEAVYKLYTSVDIGYGKERFNLESWIFRKSSPPLWPTT